METTCVAVGICSPRSLFRSTHLLAFSFTFCSFDRTAVRAGFEPRSHLFVTLQRPQLDRVGSLSKKIIGQNMQLTAH